MWLKISNLVLVLMSLAWLILEPSWEPGVTLVGLLFGLVGQEWSDARGRRRDALEHDRKLFARYDEILDEMRLKGELEGNLYNHYTNSRFTQRLHESLLLAESEGGRFLDHHVAESFKDYSQLLRSLNTFVLAHFFTPTIGEPTDADGHYALALYPEFKHTKPKAGQPDYDARAAELLPLLERVSSAFDAFRKSVKHRLSV